MVMRLSGFAHFAESRPDAPPKKLDGRPYQGPRFLAVAADRIGSRFLHADGNRSLPGRHIADCQMRLYIRLVRVHKP